MHGSQCVGSKTEQKYTLAYMTLTAAIATCIATEVKILNVSNRFRAIKHRGGVNLHGLE